MKARGRLGPKKDTATASSIDTISDFSCFHCTIDQLDELHLKRFLRFNHGSNREISLQL